MIPRDPTSNMIKEVVYPASMALHSRSAYLDVFLWEASMKLVSKQTVSSSRRSRLLVSSHNTMSGRSVVEVMCCGKV